MVVPFYVFAKQLQTAILSSISVCISVHMEQFSSHSAECYEILYWGFLLKSNPSLVNIRQKYQALYMKTNTHL